MEEVSDTTRAAAELLTENVEARLIAVLDYYTRRDLLKDPPRDPETLQRLGVNATDADRRVRKWVNDAFRRPNDWRLLARDSLPIGSTTYAKLRDYCTKR